MPAAAFTTLGCKVNQYETQRILDCFEDAGFAIVPFESPADVYVINTCSVTSIAESKSRYVIRKATRNNPSAKVIVTGCAAQMATNKDQTLEGADILVPNPDKLSTLDYLFASFPEIKRWVKQEPAPKNTIPLQSRTRATLKIQDGCSIYCSYCSIPYTRPGMISRPYQDILSEAQRLVDLGHLELILTGVLIGSYGPETGSKGPDFEDLIEKLVQIKGLGRLRISSIEMRQVTPRLIEILKTNPYLVPHLHIPLQSGDSDVLKEMNRPYTQQDYLNLCQTLYREIPHFSLTTDIMVGFPTETKERFASTIKVCHEAKYLKAHIFRFSPRYGTPADEWGDPVAPPEKQQRSHELIKITQNTRTEHYKKFLGQTMRVIVEGKKQKDGLLCGLTDNYLEVHFAGPQSLAYQMAFVRLDSFKEDKMYGEFIGTPFQSPSQKRLTSLKLL